MALILHACGPLHKMQKVESDIPCIGSIGKHRSKLFKKDFQKVGEPTLNAPLALSIRSVAFSPAMQTRYVKYNQVMGKKPTLDFKDTTQVEYRYYQMQMSDVVGLSDQLNHSVNNTLRKYVQEDQDLEVLTKVSFLTDAQTEQWIRTADHFFLIQEGESLTLEMHRGNTASQIKMSSLEVFDFETAHFCWKRDKRGKLQIANILLDGGACPGETEKDPSKLDVTNAYLKL